MPAVPRYCPTAATGRSTRSFQHVLPGCALHADRLELLLLVRPDELRSREDVALHRFFQRGLGGLAEVGQDDVEGKELVEVAVAPDGRAGAAVARALPVVGA